MLTVDLVLPILEDTLSDLLILLLSLPHLNRADLDAKTLHQTDAPTFSAQGTLEDEQGWAWRDLTLSLKLASK